MILLALTILALTIHASSYDNGVGLTPPMGWNSWNKFHCSISESLVKEMALAMVKSGLDKVGYTYINLDDCWQRSRNSSGYIQEDSDAFPNGMAALSDFVHAQGLQFGLYSDAGLRTCQGRPGGLGFEAKDAEKYAEWNVDYLKYDNCFNVGMNVHHRYQRMHDALNATGRQIFFSICEWGYRDPATWADSIGNAWRTTSDISPTWNSILHNLDSNDQWHSQAGPGGWNDPDILEVGNGRLTIAEQRSHFTLWCLVKAPLLLGNDLREIEDYPDIKKIITNKEVIVWNQDPLGLQGFKRASIATSHGQLEVWAGELFGSSMAVVLFNRSDRTQNVTVRWESLGLKPEISFEYAMFGNTRRRVSSNMASPPLSTFMMLWLFNFSPSILK